MIVFHVQSCIQGDHCSSFMKSLIANDSNQLKQEIVAEKWVLLNLGINPILDQEVAVPVSYNNSTNL
jgi:hypothetical protein